MRVLLDTKIIIYRENKKMTNYSIGHLFRWLDKLKYDKLIHPLTGISRYKYRTYYKDCKVAYAYRLGQVTRYEPAKELNEFNISSPPQSFIYIS